MDIAALHRNRAETRVTVRGETLKFAFYPDRYDDNLHAQWTGDKAVDGNNRVLAQLLVEWDMTDGGIVVPITEESLKGIPLSVKTSMIRAIMAEVNSGNSDGRSSGSSTEPGVSARTSTGSFV